MVAELARNRPSAYDRPPFSSVEQGLAAVEADGPERLASDALRDDLRWFTSIQRALEAIAAHWLAEHPHRPPAPGAAPHRRRPAPRPPSAGGAGCG